MSTTNNSIKCRVESCKHHDDCYCTLNDIVVGKDATVAHSNSDTQCMSFECEK